MLVITTDNLYIGLILLTLLFLNCRASQPPQPPSLFLPFSKWWTQGNFCRTQCYYWNQRIHQITQFWGRKVGRMAYINRDFQPPFFLGGVLRNWLSWHLDLQIEVICLSFCFSFRANSFFLFIYLFFLLKAPTHQYLLYGFFPLLRERSLISGDALPYRAATLQNQGKEELKEVQLEISAECNASRLHSLMKMSGHEKLSDGGEMCLASTQCLGQWWADKNHGMSRILPGLRAS